MKKLLLLVSLAAPYAIRAMDKGVGSPDKPNVYDVVRVEPVFEIVRYPSIDAQTKLQILDRNGNPIFITVKRFIGNSTNNQE